MATVYILLIAVIAHGNYEMHTIAFGSMADCELIRAAGQENATTPEGIEDAKREGYRVETLSSRCVEMTPNK